jgi:hypothetical protein
MNKIAKRTAHCLNVSENLIQISVKLDRDNEKYNNNAKSKTITRKDTIDQFNKDFFNTAAYNLFQKHECVTIKELKNLLEKRSYNCII